MVVRMMKRISKLFFRDKDFQLNKHCHQSSKQGGFRPLLLAEPYVNLSIHTALQVL